MINTLLQYGILYICGAVMNHSFLFMQTGGFFGLPMQALPISSGDTSKKFAIAGICWDGCLTNRPSARFGPNGIRQASHMLYGDEHPFFDTTPV